MAVVPWDIISWLLVALTSGPFPGNLDSQECRDSLPGALAVCQPDFTYPQCVSLISPVPSVSHSLPLSPGAPFYREQWCSESSVLALHAQLQACWCLALHFQAAEDWEHFPLA